MTYPAQRCIRYRMQLLKYDGGTKMAIDSGTGTRSKGISMTEDNLQSILQQPLRQMAVENHQVIGSELNTIRVQLETITAKVTKVYGIASKEATAFAIVLKRLDRAVEQMATHLGNEHELDEATVKQIYQFDPSLHGWRVDEDEQES